MTRWGHRVAGPAAGALLALAACGRTPPEPAAPAGSPAAVATSASEPSAPAEGSGDFRDVALLFPSPQDEFLHAENRRILWTASVTDRARQALTELLSGPREGLLPALPQAVRLREFFLLDDGTGFADFSGEIRSVQGADGERTALQAIVLTLTTNFPEIRRVVVLVDGEEAETLAGHVDLRYALRPDPKLLAPGLAPPPETPADGSRTSPDADGTAPAGEPGTVPVVRDEGPVAQ